MTVDEAQTKHWIAGTKSEPVQIGSIYVREQNQFLAGFPERREPYFDAMRSAAWLISKANHGVLLLTGFAVHWADTVVKNNRILQEAGEQRYYRVAYTWRW